MLLNTMFIRNFKDVYKINVKATIYHIKNIGDASASTSVTVISGGDVSAYIPIWYYLSILKPVFISMFAAIISIVGFCRTLKN